MKMMLNSIFLLMLTLLLVIRSAAQEAPPLDRNNVGDFASVTQVDFDALPDDLGQLIQTGWFVMSPDGEYIALVRMDGGLIILDNAGEFVETYTVAGESGLPGTMLDAAFGNDSQTLVSLHNDGEGYFMAVHQIGSDTAEIPFPNAGDMPVRVWLDSSLGSIWLEVAPGDPQGQYYVIRIPIAPDSGEEMLTLPSGPQNDLESYVRIGRIPAPLAITSTIDGLVKLWDLETGEITAQVQLDNVPAFGRVDEITGRYLAWRDPYSETLNVLDFEVGENQVVAALNGAYVQAILLSPAADVILGVAIGDAPIVVAWDVATGERQDLGEYRSCSRVPDMITLSRDGRSLVIGCDTGLDIWRVTD